MVISKWFGYGAVLVLGCLLTLTALADVSKASDWVGRSVVTDEGQPLGRIEDLAIDIESAQIKYLVVSIGSFLIQDSLIAVHVDALAPSAQGSALVLHSDNLASAKRFGADAWPTAPDVLPDAQSGDQPLVDAVGEANESDQRGFDRGGSATISDGRRRATYADGEGRIEAVARRSSAAVNSAAGGIDASDLPAPADPLLLPLPSFTSLDGDGDGVLSRREIGARLGRQELFPAIDVDGSGALDQFEFDLLKDARGKSAAE